MSKSGIRRGNRLWGPPLLIWHICPALVAESISRWETSVQNKYANCWSYLFLIGLRTGIQPLPGCTIYLSKGLCCALFVGLAVCPPKGKFTIGALSPEQYCNLVCISLARLARSFSRSNSTCSDLWVLRPILRATRPRSVIAVRAPG